MKNFWLARRKRRELQKIAQIVSDVANRAFWIGGLKGGLFPWRKKKP